MTKAETEQGIVWSDEFLIGVEELDYEHRCLIDDINKLHQELLNSVDIAADMKHIGDTLGNIHARMQAHFALEEHVMQAHGYPGYQKHKEEHARLLDDYTDRMNKFADNPTPEGRKSLELTLRKWTIGHITNSDKKMGQMVANSKQVSPNLGQRIKALFD